jgi:hypothetical protein
MARKPAKKTVTNNAQPGLALKPGLITVAIALGWGAMNEPTGLTMESMTIWLLSMGAVALLAHAGLALLPPLLKILVGHCQVAIAQARGEQKS